MSIPRDDMTAFLASIRALDLATDLTRFDTVHRWEGCVADFHYDQAIKAYRDLVTSMDALIAMHDAPGEAVGE